MKGHWEATNVRHDDYVVPYNVDVIKKIFVYCMNANILHIYVFDLNTELMRYKQV